MDGTSEMILGAVAIVEHVLMTILVIIAVRICVREGLRGLISRVRCCAC